MRQNKLFLGILSLAIVVLSYKSQIVNSASIVPISNVNSKYSDLQLDKLNESERWKAIANIVDDYVELSDAFNAPAQNEAIREKRTVAVFRRIWNSTRSGYQQVRALFGGGGSSSSSGSGSGGFRQFFSGLLQRILTFLTKTWETISNLFRGGSGEGPIARLRAGATGLIGRLTGRGGSSSSSSSASAGSGFFSGLVGRLTGGGGTKEPSYSFGGKVATTTEDDLDFDFEFTDATTERTTRKPITFSTTTRTTTTTTASSATEAETVNYSIMGGYTTSSSSAVAMAVASAAAASTSQSQSQGSMSMVEDLSENKANVEDENDLVTKNENDSSTRQMEDNYFSDMMKGNSSTTAMVNETETVNEIIGGYPESGSVESGYTVTDSRGWSNVQYTEIPSSSFIASGSPGWSAPSAPLAPLGYSGWSTSKPEIVKEWAEPIKVVKEWTEPIQAINTGWTRPDATGWTEPIKVTNINTGWTEPIKVTNINTGWTDPDPFKSIHYKSGGWANEYFSDFSTSLGWPNSKPTYTYTPDTNYFTNLANF